jgi:hypothetical protein
MWHLNARTPSGIFIDQNVFIFIRHIYVSIHKHECLMFLLFRIDCIKGYTFLVIIN